MLIYRDAPGMPADGEAFHRDLLARARRLESLGGASYDAAVSLAIDIGMFEAAVADRRDADNRPEAATLALRRSSVAAAAATLAARDEDLRSMQRSAARTAEALSDVNAAMLPRALRLRAPEGFAFYGLFPDLYADAADRLAAERPIGIALCLGIRSIGTTLSAFVAAALEARGVAVRSCTLRPDGHPFDRRARMEAPLAAALADPIPDVVLVADEGPGLSGTSFAAAVDAVRAAGVPGDRIVLLAAWDPDPSSLRSPRGAETWRTHRKVPVSFDEGWIATGRLARTVGAGSLDDISAGGWRRVWPVDGEQPAIQPQHERRKYLASDASRTPGARRLLKFAGLGRFGEALAARAHGLRGLPCVPQGETSRLQTGFLITDVADGSPMLARAADGGFLEVAANYLSEVSQRFRLETRADRHALAQMLEVNARELLPDARLSKLASLAREAESFEPVQATQLDARMQPHEWLRTASGYLKTDALEHHDDHFYPGPQDIAWDVAGTIEEFALDERTAPDFADAVAARLRDRTLAARLPFHRAAYLAFRAGYCSLGAGTLAGSPEGERLRKATAEYATRLAAWLD